MDAAVQGTVADGQGAPVDPVDPVDLGPVDPGPGPAEPTVAFWVAVAAPGAGSLERV